MYERPSGDFAAQAAACRVPIALHRDVCHPQSAGSCRGDEAGVAEGDAGGAKAEVEAVEPHVAGVDLDRVHRRREDALVAAARREAVAGELQRHGGRRRVDAVPLHACMPRVGARVAAALQRAALRKRVEDSRGHHGFGGHGHRRAGGGAAVRRHARIGSWAGN